MGKSRKVKGQSFGKRRTGNGKRETYVLVKE